MDFHLTTYKQVAMTSPSIPPYKQVSGLKANKWLYKFNEKQVDFPSIPPSSWNKQWYDEILFPDKLSFIRLGMKDEKDLYLKNLHNYKNFIWYHVSLCIMHLIILHEFGFVPRSLHIVHYSNRLCWSILKYMSPQGVTTHS